MNFRNSFLRNLVLIGLLTTIWACSNSDTPLPDNEQEQYEDIYEPDYSFKKVGYLPYYRFGLIDEMELSKLNYVIIAFANPNAAGTFSVGNNVNIQSVVQKAKNAGAKVLISIGGGGLSPSADAIWVNQLSGGNRTNTIVKLVNFVQQNDLDGVDVDLEGELLNALGDDYNLFVHELRKHLHAKGKAITAAVYPVSVRPNISKSALNAFDFLNIMIYNAKGLWNINDPGPHASYEFAERSVDFWEYTQGISPDKLVFGFPFYGINFDPSIATTVTYRSIVEENTVNAYSGNIDLLYYDGIPDVVNKTQLALERTNGVMIWEIGQDSYTELSLLKAMIDVIDIWPCENGPVTTFFPDEDGDGFGNHRFPVQACSAPQGYVANNIDSDDSDPNVA
jgi:chitinase